jgi:hypothetical protein
MRRKVFIVAVLSGLAATILYPAAVFLDEGGRKAQYGWPPEPGTTLAYQVFEANADVVDHAVPFDARMPGNAISKAGVYMPAAAYTSSAQMAEIADTVLGVLRDQATTNAGILASGTKKGEETWKWRPDSWSYNTGEVQGKGEGFCGMGRDLQSNRFRIRYRITHVVEGNTRVPVSAFSAEISYEGPAPEAGKARAFLMPFGREQQSEYLVIAFSVTNTSKSGPPLSYRWNFAASNATAQAQYAFPAFSNRLLQFRLVADGDERSTAETVRDEQGRELRLETSVLLGDSAVALARIERNHAEAAYPWRINVQFTPEGGRRFAEITRTNTNRRLAVVYRGRVLMAPVIRTAITGANCSIDGNFSESELADIAWHLNNAANTAASPTQESPFTAKLDSPYYGGDPRTLAVNPSLLRPNNLLDLDHRHVLHFPTEWTDWSEGRQCRWLKETNVDLAVDVRPEGPVRIITFDTGLSRIETGMLPSTLTRGQVVALLSTNNSGLDNKTNVFEMERAVYSVESTVRFPVEFAFRTAEGTVGILELVSVDTNLPPSVIVRAYNLDPAS